MPHIKRTIGDHGEQQVITYLKSRGYQILATNYACRAGEIDIIAQHNHDIIFIEVKTRQSPHFDPSLVITPSKQKKIAQTARLFISTLKTTTNFSFRCDVALLIGQAPQHTIHYIEHAFTIE